MKKEAKNIIFEDEGVLTSSLFLGKRGCGSARREAGPSGAKSSKSSK